jgi:hypothetical protein
MSNEEMFPEFSEVTREEWEAVAAKDSPHFSRMLYGPETAVAEAAPQPWRGSEWEILEAVPPGLCELAETAIPRQLQAALQSGAKEFLVPVSTQYFEEIAKFRALRRLFAEPIRIVAITARAHQTIYDPHVNLLRATTAAMSAILGGCDALVVRRFDEERGNDSGELARQLARNTQLLLREESGFAGLHDPAAGSWFLETLTQRYVEAARGDSQAETPARVHLVGVTKYSDPDECAPAGIEVSEGRLATDYEKLRVAAERCGRQPRIRLILGKDAKMSRARADFARAVFHSGGFRIGEPADFGVLCAADAEYPELVRAETNLPLIVAGPETPGAFDFVNLKSDIVEKLKSWHRHLGIA